MNSTTSRLVLRTGNPDLTRRERQVLQAAADLAYTSTISEQLGIGRETVKHHLRVIHAKLEAHNRAHAVAIGLRRGLIR